MNKIELDRWDQDGDYSKGQKKGPGCTRVLGQLFEIPGSEDNTEYLDRGTLVHQGTVQIEKGTISWAAVQDLFPHIEGFLRGYVLFLKETGWESVLMEKKVFSDRYMFGATLDRFGKFSHHMRKRWCVLEIKSGDHKHRGPAELAVRCQTAAQLQALKETFPEQVKKKKIHRAYVRLTSMGKYDLDFCNDPMDMSVYLAFNLVWKTLAQFKREW